MQNNTKQKSSKKIRRGLMKRTAGNALSPKKHCLERSEHNSRRASMFPAGASLTTNNLLAKIW